MRSDPAWLALATIRDNIGAARSFVEDMSFNAFRSSLLHVYAVTGALEIISEASRRLPEDVKARHPDLPWRAIRDVGISIGTNITMFLRVTFRKRFRPISNPSSGP